MLALQRQAQVARDAAPIETGLSLERIRFRYAISGDEPPWKPLRAFDDGGKVYIQFPAGIAQGELPPLFVIGAQGDDQLVNYRSSLCSPSRIGAGFGVLKSSVYRIVTTIFVINPN